MVAEKEGIGYEEEALSVIAEKADGGMRDALSIFDQAVSFCQGNITYQKVIEDLNVLDSENYFSIVDLSLQNKVPEVMVLLNNVIGKGFDGGHLIGGLASHIRNVLMAKDEQTLPLLEVSQRQAEKFKEQAQKCPVTFLYNALKLCNQCDINYRASSNKRLLVELTLIQIAQLTQEEDSPAAGRSPKRLKSLFQKLISNVQPKAASQGVAGRSHAAKQQPQAASAAPTAQQPSTSAAKPAASPSLRLSSLGMTFANMRKSAGIAQQEDEQEMKDTGERDTFDDDQLLLQWMSMCNRMPQTMAGLAARMKNMTPHITQLPDVEVVVDNDMLLSQLTAIKNRIRNTLARDLHNTSLKLTVRLAKADEVTRAFTKRELYDNMQKANPAIKHLGEALDLELT